MRLSREEVFTIIEQERNYQEKFDKLDQPGRQKDEFKSVETWITWMEVYLHKAKTASINTDKTETLDNLRKVIGLGVACLEFRGAPSRES